MHFLQLLLIFISSFAYSQKGCLCKDAKNYDPLAVENDGSCVYKKKQLKPIWSTILDKKLHETSGLIFWNNTFITHNDDTENWLYCLDNKNFEIVNTLNLDSIKNKDWETIAQDSTHLYIGDFGNNSGIRKNLCIYKMGKKNIIDSLVVEKISFEYSLQNSFSVLNRQNNFDCEAMVVKDSTIYLFTKNWKDQTTDVYYLPNKVGYHVAKHLINLNVKCLITDACLINDREIILCGYNKKLKPFIIKLKDFQAIDFSRVNLRRYKLKLPFHQIEAIFSTNGQEIFLTNEKFERKGIISVPMKIHFVKL